MAVTGEKVHGTDGAYVAGEWIDIEDCPERFNVSGASGESCTSCGVPCPRSRTRHSAAKADGSCDVVIIGAGCVGSAVARELSKTTASVLVLEAADDVSQGATKGNSGIVHAGFDDTPGSVRSQYCWAGNQTFPQLDRELHFGLVLNGSLVVAKGKDDEAHLQELLKRGAANGVKNLRVIGKAELNEMEPHIHPDATAALWSPDAGTVIPYEFAIALAENAADNGVEFRIRREVTGITQTERGFELQVRHWEPALGVRGQWRAVLAALLVLGPLALLALAISGTLRPEATAVMLPGATVLLAAGLAAAAYIGTGMGGGKGAGGTPPVGQGGRPVAVEEMKVGGSGSSSVMGAGGPLAEETVSCSYVVNCAGGASDAVARMVGDGSFKIKPRLGEYLLLHKDQGHLANATLFPCPGPLGKGVLVQATVWGNLILGPTARDAHNRAHDQTRDEIMAYILERCRALVPDFDAGKVIHAFAGARAKSDRNDWIIEPASTAPRMIHAAGIDSPGLAGSPAIALKVVELLKAAGLVLAADPRFNPIRAPLIQPKSKMKLADGKTALKIGPVGKYTDPASNVVCKCEKVTEAEVIEACRRSLPVDSTQTMRKRVRAGMGHCQGDPANYGCEARVAAIIARENASALEAVGRRPWPATTTLPGRWLGAAQLKHLRNLGGSQTKPTRQDSAASPST